MKTKAQRYNGIKKEIEDDIVPIGIIDSRGNSDTFVEDGDVWTVVDDDKNYGVF